LGEKGRLLQVDGTGGGPRIKLSVAEKKGGFRVARCRKSKMLKTGRGGEINVERFPSRSTRQHKGVGGGQERRQEKGKRTGERTTQYEKS